MTKDKAISTMNTLILKLADNPFNSTVWTDRAKMDLMLIFGTYTDAVKQIDKISFHSVYIREDYARREFLEKGKVHAKKLLMEYIDHINTQGLPTKEITFDVEKINLKSLWHIFVSLPTKQSVSVIAVLISIITGTFFLGTYIETIKSKTNVLEINQEIINLKSDKKALEAEIILLESKCQKKDTRKGK